MLGIKIELFFVYTVHFFSSATPIRDIKSGEELFDNYLGMTGSKKDGWKEDVLGLKAQCEGTGIGEVKEYDEWSKEEAER